MDVKNKMSYFCKSVEVSQVINFLSLVVLVVQFAMAFESFSDIAFLLNPTLSHIPWTCGVSFTITFYPQMLISSSHAVALSSKTIRTNPKLTSPERHCQWYRQCLQPVRDTECEFLNECEL
jgi:hypothetical protein